jgi:hypothetical protein
MPIPVLPLDVQAVNRQSESVRMPAKTHERTTHRSAPQFVPIRIP